MKNCWRLYNAFRRLPKSYKLEVFKISIYLSFFWLALKIVPFDKFVKTFTYIIQKKKSTNYNRYEIQETIKIVKAVSKHHVFKCNCFIQALTAKLVLRSVRDLVLNIGVSIENGFEAHAWIEKDGVYIIGEIPSSHFTPIWCVE